MWKKFNKIVRKENRSTQMAWRNLFRGLDKKLPSSIPNTRSVQGVFHIVQHMIQCRFRVNFYPGCHQNHSNPRTGLRSTRLFRFCSPAIESFKQSSLLRLSRGQRSSWKPHGGWHIRQLGWNKTKARLTNRLFSFKTISI